MENTILQDVKISIGINPDVEDPAFDTSIVMCINSAIAELAELGVGKQGDFALETNAESWDDYLADYGYLKSLVKAYINVYVKLMFDSAAQSGSMNSAMQEEMNRLGFRIQTAIEQHE